MKLKPYHMTSMNSWWDEWHGSVYSLKVTLGFFREANPRGRSVSNDVKRTVSDELHEIN